MSNEARQCPVSPQELREIADHFDRKTEPAERVMLRRLANWLEKPAPAAGLDRERSEGVYLIVEQPDRLSASAGQRPTYRIERVNGNCTVSRIWATEDEARSLINQLAEHLPVAASEPTRALSSYAFNEYGSDAKLYNGIHDLETKTERLEAELAAWRALGAESPNGMGVVLDLAVESGNRIKLQRDQARQQCKTLAGLLKEAEHLLSVMPMSYPYNDRAAELRPRITAALAAIPETDAAKEKPRE